MENLVTIISSTLLSIGASGVLVFLAKSWISVRLKGAIQHEYDQKLETLKAQLQSRHDIEITKLKADLELAAAERNFRFSHVFEKTADAIATTYKNLVNFKDAVNVFTMFYEGMQEEDKRAHIVSMLNKARTDFAEHFLTNKIYIPKSTSAKILEFSELLVKMQLKYGSVMRMEKANVNAEVVVAHMEEFERLFQRVPALLSSLEDDFQKILGFPIEAKGEENEVPKEHNTAHAKD